jgi:hypothetical protein
MIVPAYAVNFPMYKVLKIDKGKMFPEICIGVVFINKYFEEILL